MSELCEAMTLEATLSEPLILVAELSSDLYIEAELERTGTTLYYNGEYEATPSAEDQLFNTHGRTMERDFKVLAMPIGLATISQVNKLF